MKVIRFAFTAGLMILSLAATKSFALECPEGYTAPFEPHGPIAIGPTKIACNAAKGAMELAWLNDCQEDPENIAVLGTWGACLPYVSDEFWIVEFRAYLPALCCEKD